MVLALEEVEPLHLRCQDPHSERHPGTSVFCQLQIFTHYTFQERLAFCSHYKNLEALKSNPNYEYIFPPVGHFSRFWDKSLFLPKRFKNRFFSAKFGLFDEIEAAGYHHGTTFFYGLKKAGRSGNKPGGVDDSHSWLPTADRAKKAIRSSFFLSKFCDVGLCIIKIFRRKTLSALLFGFRAAERRDSGSYSFTDLAQVGDCSFFQNYVQVIFFFEAFHSIFYW